MENIKDKVLNHKLLQQVLEQISDPIEKEKTMNAINGLLDEFQGKANGLLKSIQQNENDKKTEDK